MQHHSIIIIATHTQQNTLLTLVSSTKLSWQDLVYKFLIND